MQFNVTPISMLSPVPNNVAFSPNTGCFLQPLVAYCNEPYNHTAE